MVCKYNHFVIDGVSITVQVAFIFIFLTVFFFAYVQEIEKQEFKIQLDLIVDNMTKDFENTLPALFEKQSEVTPEEIVVLVDGVISVIQEKIAIDSKGATSDIMEKNHKIKLTALHSLIMMISVTVGVCILILLLSFCIPITQQIKEAMLVVIFIGMTEFTFLQLIARKYISADPNKVKRTMCQAIQRWIAQNKQGEKN